MTYTVTSRTRVTRLAALSLVVLVLPTATTAASADPAEALQQRYTALQEQLAHNEYQRPLYLDSTDADGSTRGEAYVVVQHPFKRVVAALGSADHWCDILILHVNTKYCRPAVGAPGNSMLQVAMGRKFEQDLDDAYQVDFSYRKLHSDDKLLQVELDAASGPMGTRDYRIQLEAVPLTGEQSFIHLSYAYSYGVSARLAMQAYLATMGSSKVGFTVVSHNAAGEPEYIEGVRGAVERNTLRYSLAIEAYLGAWSAAPDQRTEKRLRDWFAATERHPLQLHEMELDEYLAMKRNEIRRQEEPIAK